MQYRADLFKVDFDSYINYFELMLKFFEGQNVGVAEQTLKKNLINKDLWDLFERLWCFSVEKRRQACVVGFVMFYF